MTIATYAEVRSKLGKGRTHLLLGNGFSISCEPCFGYGSLYEFAKANGLSPTVQAVFERLGTNNFEGVMRLLEDGAWLATHYGLTGGTSTPTQILDDLDSVKVALISAVAKTHPDHTGKVPDQKKTACVSFLSDFHNVFTTNYDLLLYWVEMHGHGSLQGQDGFRQDEDGEYDNYVVFTEHVGGNKGLFFIHGALHLYVQRGEVRKHCWSRTGTSLLQNIRAGLDAGQYPLFVAEGTADKKLEQIQRSGYLSYCLGKLERIENDLVVFGLSFGDSDRHICDVIARNRGLKRLFVGLYDDERSSTSLEVMRNVAGIVEHRNRLIATTRGRGLLEVTYFQARTCPVWSACP